MPVKTATPKQSKKQTHESLTEKLHHALSDFSHMVHEIHLKKMVKKAAHFLTDALHKSKPAAKKAAKKTVKKVAAALPVAGKSVKKAAKKPAKK